MGSCAARSVGIVSNDQVWEIDSRSSVVTLGTYDDSILTGGLRNHELLPCSDTEWDNGIVGQSGHVFASHLTGVDVGYFAQVCQAAHGLACVQRHRTDDSHPDPSSRLNEARQLDKTLAALSASFLMQRDYLNQMAFDKSGKPSLRSPLDAVALCCSARFLLYELYACNDGKKVNSSGFPTGQEAEMQRIALKGIEESVGIMHQVALRLLGSQHHPVGQSPDSDNGYHAGSILVTHALYWAASECRWYVKEGIKTEAAQIMQHLIKALELLHDRWHRAGDYIKLLEREETLSD